MNDRPRIIPTLLLDEGNLVKTIKFRKPNYLGDPINAIKIFNEKGVDELCVLDISATKNNSSPDFELLSKMASESFMPLSYGGGIKDIDQIKNLFRIGFEKVIINSSFIDNEELVIEASKKFGSQSIVVSIDYKNTLYGKKCFICNGRLQTRYNPEELVLRAEKCGAGEVLLYSIDRDGTRKGYDESLVMKMMRKVSIPIVVCGGANNTEDIKAVIDNTGVTAVAAGSMFVYFGAKNAVLINYPKEEDLFKLGIYK